MSKPSPWLIPLLLVFSGLLASCSEEQQAPGGVVNEAPEYPLTWRFALEEIEGSVQHLYAQDFKERIEALSDGRIEVDVFPYGSLGTSAELTALARNGSIDMAFASPGHLANIIPEAGVFTLHFVLSEDGQVNQQVLASDPLLDLFRDTYRKSNMQLLSFVPEGWMAWTSNQPLRTPEDFQGFRIRTMTASIAAEAYKAYGAIPVPTAFAEVYTALQLRRIDGQVNPVFAIEEMAFYEVQSHLTLPHHAQFISSVIANEDWYDQLTPQQHRWLTEALAGVNAGILEQQQALNASRLEQIREQSDIRVTRLDEQQRARFREASLPARETFIAQTGEQGRVILEALLDMVAKAESANQPTPDS